MDRYKDTLIRQVFETERDMLWAQTVETQAKSLGVDLQKLEFLREAFNQHMENRDWAWWQERATRKYSAEELAEVLADAIDRADALGMEGGQQRKDRTM